MRKIFLFITLAFTFLNTTAQTFLFEDFENGGTMPENWYQEDVDSAHNGEWTFEDGGHDGYPPSASSGSYNAIFVFPSLSNEKSILVTPPINTITSIDPVLKFQHAQKVWFANNDELRVFYKLHEDSAWTLIAEYTNEVYNFSQPSNPWVQQIIDLPDSSTTYYIGFEGTTKFGHGVCIDDVEVVETAVIQKSISEIEVIQASTDFVYNGSTNNKVLRINLKVFGNSGSLPLKSLTVHSDNMDVGNIALNGVKLFKTPFDEFLVDSLIGTAQSFQGDSVTFSNINYELNNGDNYFWVAFDVSDTANYEQFIDAKILTNRIDVADTLYPDMTANPLGVRYIYQAAFADDFETDKGWILNGEFERDSARGKGGKFFGFPDPDLALSGHCFIGTDISGMGLDSGDYEFALSNRYDSAVSPMIDLYYYREPMLRMYKQLNIDYLDRAYIDVSGDGGNSWINIWESDNGIFTTDNNWKLQELDIAEFFERDSLVKFRIALGPTDSTRQFSGWNIDNFVITGDPIEYDPSVVEIITPQTSCGMGLTPVTVKVKNFGLKDLTMPIPIAYSLDNGATFVYDEITTPIPFKDSIVFTFSVLADLSTPDFYDEFVVYTDLAVDDYRKNDTLHHEFYSLPINSLPYSENFDGSEDFWVPYGDSSSWEMGTPNYGSYNTAASGANCWATALDTTYNHYEASYLEGPCFDMTSADFSMIECNLLYDTEADKDGVALQYSTDGGFSWDTIGMVGNRWNWYNGSSITSLNSSFGNPAGWTNNSGGWTAVGHLLPEELRDYSSAKFRFVFANEDTVNEYFGVAIDDIVIRETPPDVAIVDILTPDSACELSHNQVVKVAIKNYGLDTLDAGTTIPIGITVNNNHLFTQGVTLHNDVLSGDTLHVNLANTIDVWSAGDYYLKVFTALSTDENFFSDGNDTAFKQIAVYGMPDYTLGPDIVTTYPDTVVLDAGSGYTQYEWSDGSDGQFLALDTAGYYSVTVTNSFGCTAEDTIRVLFSSTDLGVTEIVNIDDACDHSLPIFPQLTIKNFGIDTIMPDDTVHLGIYVNGMPALYEELIMLLPVYPNNSFGYTFSNSIDLSGVATYEIKAFSDVTLDAQRLNDTIMDYITTYGIPDVDLGEDVIYTLQADTITLDPGPGYSNYYWQNGSTSQTFTISSLHSATYSVTVTDANNCPNSDSVFINANDFVLESINQPVSDCELSNAELIEVTVRNLGNDTLNPGYQHKMGFVINGGDEIIDTLTVSSVVNYNETFNLIFNTGADLSQDGEYELIVFNTQDANTTNDSLAASVSNYANPIVDLGDDTIYTYQPDTIVLDAGAGFAGYEWSTGSFDQSIQVTDFGLYWVIVEDNNGCYGSDSVLIIEGDGVIELVEENLVINVFPNPISDKLTIDFETDKQLKVVYYLMDENSRFLSRKTLKVDGYTQEIIDFAKWSKGVYHLVIQTKTSKESIKLVKQ